MSSRLYEYDPSAFLMISNDIKKEKKYNTDEKLSNLLTALNTKQRQFNAAASKIKTTDEKEDRMSILLEYINPIDDSIYNILKHIIINNYGKISLGNFATIMRNNYNFMNYEKNSTGDNKFKKFITDIYKELESQLKQKALISIGTDIYYKKYLKYKIKYFSLKHSLKHSLKQKLNIN